MAAFVSPNAEKKIWENLQFDISLHQNNLDVSGLLECAEKVAGDLTISFTECPSQDLVANDPYFSCISDFDSKVDMAEPEEARSKIIKDSFRALCRERIFASWAKEAIKSFCPLLYLSDKEEQILAAQKWSYHFLLGIQYFQSLTTGRPGFSDYDFACFKGAILAIFTAHIQEITLKETESMVKLLRENQGLFDERYRLAISQMTNKTDLTYESFKFLEFAENITDTNACILVHKFPSIERKKGLLEVCLMNLDTLLKSCSSFFESKDSSRLFRAAISIYQEKSQNAFFKCCQ